MTGEILAVIGSVLAIVLWFLKNKFGKEAKYDSLIENRDRLLQEIQVAIVNGDTDSHNRLYAELQLVREALRRHNRQG